jgi:hypothetical protein
VLALLAVPLLLLCVCYFEVVDFPAVVEHVVHK